jgi:hypothetical protein
MKKLLARTNNDNVIIGDNNERNNEAMVFSSKDIKCNDLIERIKSARGKKLK